MNLITHTVKTVKLVVLLLVSCSVFGQSIEDVEINLKLAKGYLKDDKQNKTWLMAVAALHDQLAQYHRERKNDSEAQAYLDSAVYFYSKTLQVDPNYFDALYGFGVLHYNIAVGFLQHRAALPLSSRDEYKELTEEAQTRFRDAHGYLVRAEKQDPSNPVFLNIFREMYIQTGNTEGYYEYNRRLEKYQNDTSTSFEPYPHPPSSSLKL